MSEIKKLEEYHEGTVKFFNEEKGFGFFQTNKGDVFFHIKNFRRANGQTGELIWMSPDELGGAPKIESNVRVRFSKAESKRGPQAPFWTFEGHFVKVLASLDRMPIYRLVHVERREGMPRTNNVTKVFEIPITIIRTALYFARSVRKVVSRYREFCAGLGDKQDMVIERESCISPGTFEEITFESLLKELQGAVAQREVHA